MTAAVVIPAFNEADSIVGVVSSVRDYATPIVVDDGSCDETGARAASAGAEVVRHDVNRGYDAALASGFARAEQMNADAIVTFDADGQLDAAAVSAAIRVLAEGRTDLVLGVRNTGGARLSERLFNIYTRRRFGAPDILCGLKGFRIGDYVAHRSCMKTRSVNTALALALLRHGAVFAMVPVAVRPREGQSRYGGFWRANRRIFRALAGALMDDLQKR